MTADTSTFTAWEQDLMRAQTEIIIDLFLTQKELIVTFLKFSYIKIIKGE